MEDRSSPPPGASTAPCTRSLDGWGRLRSGAEARKRDAQALRHPGVVAKLALSRKISPRLEVGLVGAEADSQILEEGLAVRTEDQGVRGVPGEGDDEVHPGVHGSAEPLEDVAIV